MTTRELLIVAGGIGLALFLVPFGGSATLPGILLIAAIVVLDLARERRKRPK